MSKKNFKTAFDSLLGEDDKKFKHKNKAKEVRATFIVNINHLEKLKAISFWEKKMIKHVLDEALSGYLERYETTKGPVKLPEWLYYIVYKTVTFKQ